MKEKIKENKTKQKYHISTLKKNKTKQNKTNKTKQNKTKIIFILPRQNQAYQIQYESLIAFH